MILYKFIITDISDNEQNGFEVYIPAFRATIYGSDMEEVLEGVKATIEYSIEQYQEEGKTIPIPDRDLKYSGKFTLRVQPSLHEKLASLAASEKLSLNSYIEQKLGAVV
jgi:antitoxin HicB